MTAILVGDRMGGWRETAETFDEAHAHTPIDRAAVAHALSMSFTDMQLKTYIELRPADVRP